MADIQKIEGKKGSFYKVRISDGFHEDGRPYRVKRSFHPEPGLSQREINRQLDLFVKKLEIEVRQQHDAERIKGASHNASKQLFREHAKAYLDMCEKRKTIKKGTIDNYRAYLSGHIDDVFGNRPIGNITTKDIDKFLNLLMTNGVRKDGGYAVPSINIYDHMKSKGYTQKKLAEICGLSEYTVALVASRKEDISIEKQRIAIPTAQKIADGLEEKIGTLFILHPDTRPLSDKTVLENYKLLATVFSFAYKRGYISTDPMTAVMRPVYRRKKIEAWSPEQVRTLWKTLENVPVEDFRWRVFVTLLIATAARREEIAGLQWKHILFDAGEDLDGNKDGSCIILIEQGLVSSKDYGIYLDSTKGNDKRPLKLTKDVADLLREYHTWYAQMRKTYIADDGTDTWRVPTNKRTEKLAQAFPPHKKTNLVDENDFLFVQYGGYPGNPDSINNWLKKFTQENDLPHLNPHLIRHSIATSMFGNPDFGIKVISTSLGHASTAVTEAVYIDRLKATNAVRSKPIFDPTSF